MAGTARQSQVTGSAITSGSISCRPERWLISHRIRNVTLARDARDARRASSNWRCCREHRCPRRASEAEPAYSWRFAPDAHPCLSLVSLADRTVSTADELFGIFDSPRKARNALRRIAAAHELCHSLLGIAEGPAAACPGLRRRSGRCRLRPRPRASWPSHARLLRVAGASRSCLAVCGAHRDPRALRPAHRRSMALPRNGQERRRNSRRAGNASRRLQCARVPPACEDAAKLPERRIVMLATRPQEAPARNERAESARSRVSADAE